MDVCILCLDDIVTPEDKLECETFKCKTCVHTDCLGDKCFRCACGIQRGNPAFLRLSKALDQIKIFIFMYLCVAVIFTPFMSLLIVFIDMRLITLYKMIHLCGLVFFSVVTLCIDIAYEKMFLVIECKVLYVIYINLPSKVRDTLFDDAIFNIISVLSLLYIIVVHLFPIYFARIIILLCVHLVNITIRKISKSQ